jgi:serine/threonine-protein kinase
LGVVLYEALTGRKPFGGDTPVAVARAMLSTSAPRPSDAGHDVDADLDEAVVRALAPSPVERYPDAATMAAALTAGTDAVRRDDDTSTAVSRTPAGSTVASERVATSSFRVEPPTLLGPAVPPGDGAPGRQPPSARPGRPRRRGRGPVVVAALVLAMAAGGLVLVQSRRTAGPTPAVTASTTAPAATPTAPLPAPLDQAIDDLQRDVQP